MAVNQVQICNIALSRLGHGKIQSMTEASSTGALYCNLHYDSVRQFLLRSHAWGFAKETEALALTTVTPLNWLYEYQKPSLCLRILGLTAEGGTDLVRTFSPGEMRYLPSGTSGEPTPYDIVGDKIHTNLQDAYCAYSIDIVDETKFDAVFVDLLAWRLAFEVSMPLTGKHVLRDKMEAQYLKALVTAKGLNSNERQPARQDAASRSDLVKARQ